MFTDPGMAAQQPSAFRPPAPRLNGGIVNLAQLLAKLRALRAPVLPPHAAGHGPVLPGGDIEGDATGPTGLQTLAEPQGPGGPVDAGDAGGMGITGAIAGHSLEDLPPELQAALSQLANQNTALTNVGHELPPIQRGIHDHAGQPRPLPHVPPMHGVSQGLNDHAAHRLSGATNQEMLHALARGRGIAQVMAHLRRIRPV